MYSSLRAYNIIMCLKKRGMKGGDNCALCAKSGLQSEVLYYDDNAVLTMQCDAQSYFKL